VVKRLRVTANGDLYFILRMGSVFRLAYESNSAYFIGDDNLTPGYTFFKVSISVDAAMGY